MERLLKLSDVAEILGLRVSTVRKHMKERRLGFVKLGSVGKSPHRLRVRESDLALYMESFAVAPAKVDHA